MIRHRLVIAVLLTLALGYQGVAMGAGAHDHGPAAPDHAGQMNDTACHGGDLPGSDADCPTCASCTAGLTQYFSSMPPLSASQQVVLPLRHRNIHSGPEGPPPKVFLLS